MKAIRKNDMGVSPVIAVILMVAITVVLAGVVFLWAQSFTDDAGGDVETLNIRGEIDVNGLTVSSVDYSCLSLEVISGKIDWTKYKVTIETTVVYTSSTTAIGTANTGESNAGDTAFFSATTLTGTDALVSGTEYSVKIVNIGDNKVVWDNDIIATA
ncbi:MAG: type IV pilin [Candidatus Thermoplasmatota archaeon]|nr:type IV pilin [Candidatus Thermoplasmatota archaeon]